MSTKHERTKRRKKKVGNVIKCFSLFAQSLSHFDSGGGAMGAEGVPGGLVMDQDAHTHEKHTHTHTQTRMSE